MTLGRPDCLCFQLKVDVYVASLFEDMPHRQLFSAGNTDSVVSQCHELLRSVCS